MAVTDKRSWIFSQGLYIGDTTARAYRSGSDLVLVDAVAGAQTLSELAIRDHSLLDNTHNLTTDIDHDSINNTHNLTTDISHSLISDTHNLTTDIDHDQLTNFVLNEHINWTSASDNFSTTGTLQSAAATIVGSQDTEQLTIRAHSAQTSPFIRLETSGGSALLTVGIAGTTNILMGVGAGASLTSGTYNYLLGSDAGAGLSSGDYNLSLGYGSLQYNQTGDGNVCIGYEAGKGASGQSPASNVFIGFRAGYQITTGNQNFGLGHQSLYAATTAITNVAIGAYSLFQLQTGYDNVAIGYSALYAATGKYNIGIGRSALGSVTSGEYNTAIGVLAGQYNYAGSFNTYIGTYSGVGASGNSQYYNTAVGASTLSLVTTGWRNHAFGYYCGRNINTGSDNILIGYRVGDILTSGSNNILIGQSINPAAASSSYVLNIGGLITGDLSAKTLTLAGTFTELPLLERSSDPSEPTEGTAVIWMSDGTGKGDDGDILIASKAGGATKWATILDHSAGAAW